MKEWIKVSLILCSFGFFREFRPSEPFVTEFLTDNRWRNVTSDQVNREIYPIGTISYFSQLFIVFLITDILRYKPIIIASAFVALALWSLLLWTSSIEALYLVQVCYGFFMAAEVAYYTYMYAKVEREKYQKVTGQTRASLLFGRFFASVLAQILYSTKTIDIRQLNYISLGAQLISLVISFYLPSVGTSIYMWSVDTSNQTNYIQAEDEIENDRKKRSSDLSSIKPKFSWRRARNLLWKHFIESYSNVTVLVWSIWWSLAMAGFLQIQSYVQILWQDIDEERESLFNGGVEAALTLFGAISCLIAGYIPNTIFEKFDLWILTLCSLIEGIMITISGVTNEIWIAYIMYVLFGVVYMFMITLVTATVAKNIADDSFALIFGINTFIALVIQTILTVVFVTNFGFALSPRMQFIVLGGYFLVLTGIFLVASIVKLICHCHKE